MTASLLAMAGAPRSSWALGGPAPGAVSAQTVKLPARPGSVRGLAEDGKVASFTGQVEYEVPIELPPGPGGFGPALALAYGGELGNGPLGVGWAISQVSVRRSLRLGVPSYDSGDELEVTGLGPGGLLVRLADGSYRLEGQGHSVTGIESSGGFELTAADGTVYRLGTSAESRKASGSGVAAWYLQEARNAQGQVIHYHYQQLAGEVYLSEVTWGPVTDGEPAFRAELVYEARPDPVVSHRTGFRVETSRRLDKLVVWSAAAVRRVVELSYDDSGPLTRLAQVRVESADGQVSLPPVTFQYAQASAPVTQQLGGTGGWALNASGTSLFDVDDDGVMDLLRLTSTGHSYRRNLGGSFEVARAVPGADGASLTSVRLLDLTGDSGAEMVWQQGSQWKVFQLGGTGVTDRSWSALGNWPGAQNLSLSQMAVTDLDGDYRMDVISSSGSSVVVRMGTAAGLAAPVSRAAIDPARTFITPGSSATSLLDINGDGLADVAYLASSALYLYLGRGDGTFERYRDLAYPWAGSFDLSQIRLGDLDRDGLLDLAIVRAGNVAWYRGRAGGAVSPLALELPRPPGTDAAVVVAVADGNGNGSEDLIWSSSAGMWLLDFAGATSAGMLTSIDNGLGQRQSFGYAASAQLALAAEASGAPWSTRMPLSIPVTVSERRVLGSGEPPRSQRLDVRDGLYDRVERRFLGFAESVVTRPDPADGGPASARVREVTRYSGGSGLDRALRGQVLSERLEDGSGALLRETSYQVGTVAVVGLDASDGRLRRAVVHAVQTQRHEGVATALVSRTEHGYDSEGRQIEERRLGRLDLSGDETLVRRRYSSGRSSSGVRDVVCEEWESGLAGDPPTAVAGSHAQMFYGAGAAIAPLCDPGDGKVRHKRQYLTEQARWVTTYEADYDNSGNLVRTRKEGVTRELTYDAQGLYPVAEVVRPSATRELRWQMTWEPRLGVPASVRDAAGVDTVIGSDGLGRLLSLARAGHAAHVEFRYRDGGPRPYVETFTFDGPIDAVTPLPAAWTAASRWRHGVMVSTSAGEPLFSATRLDEDRWIVSERRTRDALARTIAQAEMYEVRGELSALVAGAQPPTTVATQFTYDALDRVLSQTAPSGARSTFSYRAFEATMSTDGLAPVTRRYDGQNRVWQTSRSVAGQEHGGDVRYDAAGRVLHLVLAGGAEHSFTYDSLGRLASAHDPEQGTWQMSYDDAGRLVGHRNGAGQLVQYAYDGAGRLASVTTEVGAQYLYHYDDPVDGATFGYTAGRLAYVDEPTGRVELGYDPFGQLVRSRRSVAGEVAEQTTVRSASGLVLSQSDGAGLELPVSYDAAGRLVGVGTLWQLEEQDAAGRSLRERFGNGVVQRTTRNAWGQTSELAIARPSGQELLRAQVAYNAYGALASVLEVDGVGLDASATFSYDGAARLTSATVGSGAGTFTFRYQYDALQNLIRREAVGPRVLGALVGDYRYGENGAAPRQLTSVLPDPAAGSPPGAPVSTFSYDGAGRTVRQGARTMTYNGLDQMLLVGGLPGGEVTHAYGYDGLRVRTVAPSGAETLWFSPSLWQRPDGTREYDVRVGERLVARVSRPPAALAQQVLAGALRVARGVWFGLIAAMCFAMLALAWRQRGQARERRAVLASVTLVCVLGAGCNTRALSTERRESIAAMAVTYYHHSVSAGPAISTRGDGSIFEERRYEPFGAAIDSLSDGGVAEEVNFADDPHNSLGKLTDDATGWSDHGARWLAPEAARWLSPDPMVRGPSEQLAQAPWSAHPYQYVSQNPVLYWDPDGRQQATVTGMGSGVLQRDDGARYRLSEAGRAVLGPLFHRVWDFDVSKVRVVFGPTGKGVDAVAYGNLVVVNRQAWDSADQLSRLRLLAHEITHSVQFERLAAPAPFAIGGAILGGVLAGHLARQVATAIDRDSNGVVAAIAVGLVTAVVAYDLIQSVRFSNRYEPEFARSDNYRVPRALRATPMEAVDPVDSRYTLDQIAERTALEVKKMYESATKNK